MFFTHLQGLFSHWKNLTSLLMKKKISLLQDDLYNWCGFKQLYFVYDHNQLEKSKLQSQHLNLG